LPLQLLLLWLSGSLTPASRVVEQKLCALLIFVLGRGDVSRQVDKVVKMLLHSVDILSLASLLLRIRGGVSRVFLEVSNQLHF